MKKSLKRITVFILVLSMVISIGVNPYANEIPSDESHEDSKVELQEEPVVTPEEPGEIPEEPREIPEEPGETREEPGETPEESGEAPGVPENPGGIPELPGDPIATIIVNHLLGSDGLLETEIFEGFQIGEVVSGTDFIMEREDIVFVESNPSELLLEEGDNELNLYYDSTVGATTKITINHYKKLDSELGDELELLETEIIEALEIGEVVFAIDFTKKFEGIRFVEGDPSEILLEEGDNELNLYYSTVGPTTKLTVNHYKKLDTELEDGFEFSETEAIEVLEKETIELLETEIIDGLEIGITVYPVEFIKEFEGIMFLESGPSELLLQEEGNEVNLYYGPMNEDIVYISEAPDFPPGEGMEVESPYIEEFNYGELGPFLEVEDLSSLSLLNLMSLESYPDEINNKTWPQPGSLKINKTGQPVPGTGNQFEIKLEIEGKNKVETSDIVLVMDRSGSMKDGGRMTNAKAAAVSFVNTILSDPNNTSTRIALVSFGGDVTVNQQFKGYSDKATLINSINGLTANGGTHIQAGIKQGSAVLDGSGAMNKTIVFLGDGGATYSYKPKSPNNYLEYWYSTGSGTRRDPYVEYRRTTLGIPETGSNGFEYSSNVGNGMQEYTEYNTGTLSGNYRSYSNNYRHGAHAVAEAGFAKAKGQTIYTIALGAGPEGEWTLQNMADSGNYYNTPDPANLTQIYQEIAGILANAATNAVVTDPLGDMYDILGINASNYNSLITVSHGTLSYDTVTKKITWNIGTISEGTIYWMKYKVALYYSAEGGVFYPANKPTYISYKNIDGNNGKKYFPIPEFRLRELKFTKILSNGKPGDGSKKFDIILEGPAGPYKKTWSVSLTPGESKKIKGLLPGSYIVKEIVPMNFKLVGMSGGGISSSGQLVIGENDWKISIDVKNKRSNGGWFWDDPDPKINRFTVGNPGSTHGALPTDNKSLYVKLDYFVIPATLEKEHIFYQG